VLLLLSSKRLPLLHHLDLALIDVSGLAGVEALADARCTNRRYHVKELNGGVAHLLVTLRVLLLPRLPREVLINFADSLDSVRLHHREVS